MLWELIIKAVASAQLTRERSKNQMKVDKRFISNWSDKIHDAAVKICTIRSSHVLEKKTQAEIFKLLWQAL